jgi:L-seryl-tRNA(Ser) seleniumtransferase
MTEDRNALLRLIPAVNAVLEDAGSTALADEFGRPMLVEAVRAVVDTLRETALSGNVPPAEALTVGTVIAEARAILESAATPQLRRVVNATGIILHTGLGRAVLPRAAIDALGELWSCSNVQMDLDTGERIRRETAVSETVRQLTGAEDVLLVNNNAGATMLVLRALAKDREVVVSRGELIEIGGSFRLPDIMRESGAIMREVGATNKTHLRDYEAVADTMKTGLLFKAHKSNYQIVGFTKEVGTAELAELGRGLGIPVVDDLGCGALIGLERFGLGHEMTVRESLEAGADIALFSTDKLIGGPQGGMIVGRADLLGRIRKDPLYRALRVGKMTLTALEATLKLFLDPAKLPERHPTYFMLDRTIDALREQASAVISAIGEGCTADVVDEPSYLGGGSLPGSSIPSIAIRLSSAGLATDALALAMRRHATPVIPHVRESTVLLNMRTVLPDEVNAVIAAIEAAHERN